MIEPSVFSSLVAERVGRETDRRTAVATRMYADSGWNSLYSVIEEHTSALLEDQVELTFAWSRARLLKEVSSR